ncbi:MAG: HAD-IIIA family hydrolase [Nitrospinae bacterium]|nr:HAD-IIIA family hydrolase [Nitrospinota bacterium]
MDVDILRALNGITSPWWEWAMVGVTTPENWYPVLVILAAGMVWKDRRRALLALLAAGIAVGVGDALAYYIIKALVARARPCIELEGINAMAGCVNSFSFPSNHAVNSLAVAGAIGFYFRPLLWALVPVGILVCVSRVAVGAHYPSDVLAGAIIGFALGWGVSYIVKGSTVKKSAKRKAVFLDRDGCVNVEDDHIRNIEQFRLYPETLESIKNLNEAGFLVVVITNQSGVARGFFTEDLVNDVHKLLVKWVDEAGAKIDLIQYCPHHPEGVVEQYAIECDCRKPKPGMILRAAEELDIDLSRSYVVGDKISDIELGPACGMKSALALTGFGQRELEKIRAGESAEPDFVAEHIGDAVRWILKDSGGDKK